MTEIQPRRGASETVRPTISRIAAAVTGNPEGQDAAALAALLAAPTGAEVMLVAVHPDPIVVMPSQLGWSAMHAEAEALLRQTRDTLVPDARIDVETDWSSHRALERVVTRSHRDLLVVGSSDRAPDGGVRIGKRTRQLFDHCRCAIAVAPRGLAGRPDRTLARIGVGYDATPGADAALTCAAELATAAGATLVVLRSGSDSLREDTDRALTARGIKAEVDIVSDKPAAALLTLSSSVDLLVVGSPGGDKRKTAGLGSVSEALTHDGRCPILIVPRPPAADADE